MSTLRTSAQAYAWLMAAALVFPGALRFPSSSAQLMAQSPQLFDFALEDQFKHEWTRADVAGQTLVVLLADREGSAWSEDWGRTLTDSLQAAIDSGQLRLMPVAHARGVPFFIKGMVRGSFSDDPDRWVLIDWGGEFAQRYPFVEQHTNLLVFSEDGVLVAHFPMQAPAPESLASVLECVRSAMAAGVAGDPGRDADPRREAGTDAQSCPLDATPDHP